MKNKKVIHVLELVGLTTIYSTALWFTLFSVRANVKTGIATYIAFGSAHFIHLYFTDKLYLKEYSEYKGKTVERRFPSLQLIIDLFAWPLMIFTFVHCMLSFWDGTFYIKNDKGDK